MGQFSWLDCVDKTQIFDNEKADVYVLVPKEFGGGHIKETCYDGYGNFGGNDIYDLVADWNREYLSSHPNFILPDSNRKVSSFAWYPYYSDLSLSREEVVAKVDKGEWISPEWRTIGIDIACYDADNFALPYPIKITHNPEVIYEDCIPSPSDPDQGWRMDEPFDFWV